MDQRRFRRIPFEAEVLVAVGDRRDPVTGLPDWYSTRVRVEAV